MTAKQLIIRNKQNGVATAASRAMVEVAEGCHAAPLRGPVPRYAASPADLALLNQSLMRETLEFGHETNLGARLDKLDQCCAAIVAEFEKIGSDEGLGVTRILFNSTLA